VFKWHKRFAQRRDSLEDDDHTGRPRSVRTELKIQKVKMPVRANRSQTVHEVAAAGISHGTCHKILSEDLNMSRNSNVTIASALKVTSSIMLTKTVCF
jgi:hypothetical protein